MNGVRVPEGDVGREIRSRHSSLPCPALFIRVYRCCVVQGQAVLDCISVAIQEEHEMLSVGSELQLEVLLLVVEEERLHHLVLPQLEERLSTLRGWVSEEGRRYPDDQILTITFKGQLHRFM